LGVTWTRLKSGLIFRLGADTATAHRQSRAVLAG
jgi:hypothetical protein